MRTFWTILVLTLFVNSCTTYKRCLSKFPPVTETNTEYIETIKVDTITLPGDSLIIETEVPCDDFDVITENSALRSEISVLNGKLVSKVTLKLDTVYMPSKTIFKTKYVKEVVTVKECPKFTRSMAWIGAGLILIIILYVIAKIKRII